MAEKARRRSASISRRSGRCGTRMDEESRAAQHVKQHRSRHAPNHDTARTRRGPHRGQVPPLRPRMNRISFNRPPTPAHRYDSEVADGAIRLSMTTPILRDISPFFLPAPRCSTTLRFGDKPDLWFPRAAFHGRNRAPRPERGLTRTDSPSGAWSSQLRQAPSRER